jgi:hypothetical protein
MEYLYGTFSDSQIADFKEKLHKKLFWLLLYKDPKTADKYTNVDFKKYFVNLMKEIDGLNELLFYPPQIVEITCLLQTAYRETKQNPFNYHNYRKCILDAHSLVDKIQEVSK